MQFQYFDEKKAKEIVKKMLEKTGDTLTIQNNETFSSILQFVMNDNYYPRIEDKVTYLFYSFNRNHCLLDGNKRASLLMASLFLEINGFGFIVSSFMKKMENFSIYVAENKIDKSLLLEIIQSILYEDDYSEYLKIKIFNAIF